ncbi:molecular chaperone [Vibrio sp. S9_S30]|uniref:molecular chaperone n=1 Tax=Vibrio sp. S9_S30 TaxID=2720226 RepID=UPI00168067A8|nr:molecular chaperone [Vibrio sp. S9_S30]MBD1555673.1 molecular chaperone [Vibrio sp. S9_S30]
MSYAQLKIAPTRIVTEGEQPSTHKLFIENTTSEPIRVKVSVIYRSALVGNDKSKTRLQEGIEVKEDLSQFVKVSPPIIGNLKPNQRRTVRVRIQGLPSEYEEGEYRTYLLFQPVPISSQDVDKNSDGQSMTMNLDFIINTMIPVYSQKGSVERRVHLECKENSIRVYNQSNFQLKGKLVSGNDVQNVFLVRNASLDKPVRSSVGAQFIVDDQIVSSCQ